jgi:hypothetical protein
MSQTIVVILSGGSGTRLWPLSRELSPKQLLPLVGQRTLLQDTVLRSRSLSQQLAPPIVVCSEDHRFLVAEQLREIGVRPQTTVLEPKGRNTAPALAIAALLARQGEQTGARPSVGRETSEPILLVSPADHVILNTAAFAAAVGAAADAARAGHLVTLGIVPDRPETGYGYIERGKDQGRWSLVDKFVEKPDLPTAKRYVESGRYLWNSGMFVCTPSTPPIRSPCCRSARRRAQDHRRSAQARGPRRSPGSIIPRVARANGGLGRIRRTAHRRCQVDIEPRSRSRTRSNAGLQSAGPSGCRSSPLGRNAELAGRRAVVG